MDGGVYRVTATGIVSQNAFIKLIQMIKSFTSYASEVMTGPFAPASAV